MAAVHYKNYQTAGTTAMVLPACCHHSVIRAGAWFQMFGELAIQKSEIKENKQ